MQEVGQNRRIQISRLIEKKTTTTVGEKRDEGGLIKLSLESKHAFKKYVRRRHSRRSLTSKGRWGPLTCVERQTSRACTDKWTRGGTPGRSGMSLSGEERSRKERGWRSGQKKGHMGYSRGPKEKSAVGGGRSTMSRTCAT